MAQAQAFSTEEIQAQLEEFGWAVVPNVVPEPKCDEYIGEIKQWLKHFPNYGFKHIHSIIHHYNIAHIAPAWKVRIDVKPVFAGIWGTDKLHTSMDGIAIGQPPELGRTQCTDEMNLHLDQGPKKQGLHAYQGAVYLEEAKEEDWTFAVIEKSHKFHKDFFLNHRSKGSEFRPLSQPEVNWYEAHGCSTKRLAVPKGGIVLWDSRTVHAGAPPPKLRDVPKWRYIVFVSMTPAIWSRPEDLKARKECYTTLRVSRHWSSQGFSMFSHRKDHKANINEMPEAGKSMEARLLAGDLDYDFSDGQSNGPAYKPVVTR